MRTTAIFLFIWLGLSVFVVAQTHLLDSVVSRHKVFDYSNSTSFFTKLDTTDFNSYQRAIYCYEKGRYVSNIEADLQESYKLQLEAKLLMPKDSLSAIFNINDELIYSQLSTDSFAIAPERLKIENKSIAAQTNDPLQQIFCYYYDLPVQLKTSNGRKTAIKNLHKSIRLAQQINDKNIECSIKANLALAFQGEEQLDSAIYYYQEIIPYFKSEDRNDKLLNLYINLGDLYEIDHNYENSINFYNKALSLSEETQSKEANALIKRSLAGSYLSLKNYKKSASLYNDYVTLNDSISELANSEKLSELQAKYDLAQKEKEIAQKEVANERMQKISIFLGGLAIVVGLLGLGFYYRQKKRRIIAEQAESIEKQRADTLLKNQQLISIDAMISGQEQERQKVAQELHDDLGSTMTTIRLYFDNIRNDQSKENATMFDRTNDLLEEAYDKIRNMSHVKNQGIVASKGLIPAVESLASKISKSKKLNVEVIHYGLDKALDNSFELKIFRIIQELLNNVVKHADATNCFINLTSYENQLNIMIEDDGKGFHYVPQPNNDGIGLYSIEQRIDHMEGTFQVDSAVGRGTTINIDVPL